MKKNIISVVSSSEHAFGTKIRRTLVAAIRVEHKYLAMFQLHHHRKLYAEPVALFVVGP